MITILKPCFSIFSILLFAIGISLSNYAAADIYTYNFTNMGTFSGPSKTFTTTGMFGGPPISITVYAFIAPLYTFPGTSITLTQTASGLGSNSGSSDPHMDKIDAYFGTSTTNAHVEFAQIDLLGSGGFNNLNSISKVQAQVTDLTSTETGQIQWGAGYVDTKGNLQSFPDTQLFNDESLEPITVTPKGEFLNISMNFPTPQTPNQDSSGILGELVITTTGVPEPTTMAILGSGLAIAALRRKFAKTKAS